MNRLDSILAHRMVRGRVATLRKIIVLPIVVALILLAIALTMVTLPPTTAEASAHLALLCDPGDPDYPKTPTTEKQPSLARPRASTTGKDLNGGELLPGDEILWTVTVKNLGDKLTGIVITDVVPEWTTYVNGSIEGAGADDSGSPTLTWAAGSLKCGQRVTVSFRSRVDDGVAGGTLISNSASADSAQTPPGLSKAATLKVADSTTVSTADLSASSTSTTMVTVVDLTTVEDALRGLLAFLTSWSN